MEATDDADSSDESTTAWWSFVDNKQFWKWLLIGGILLNVFTAFSSELGVDTHTRLAEDDDGSLVWGHTRPIDNLASDPNYCLLSKSDAADDSLRVDLGGRRLHKQKKNKNHPSPTDIAQRSHIY